MQVGSLMYRWCTGDDYDDDKIILLIYIFTAQIIAPRFATEGRMSWSNPLLAAVVIQRRRRCSLLLQLDRTVTMGALQPPPPKICDRSSTYLDNSFSTIKSSKIEFSEFCIRTFQTPDEENLSTFCFSIGGYLLSTMSCYAIYYHTVFLFSEDTFLHQLLVIIFNEAFKLYYYI